MQQRAKSICFIDPDTRKSPYFESVLPGTVKVQRDPFGTSSNNNNGSSRIGGESGSVEYPFSSVLPLCPETSNESLGEILETLPHSPAVLFLAVPFGVNGNIIQSILELVGDTLPAILGANNRYSETLHQVSVAGGVASASVHCCVIEGNNVSNGISDGFGRKVHSTDHIAPVNVMKSAMRDWESIMIGAVNEFLEHRAKGSLILTIKPIIKLHELTIIIQRDHFIDARNVVLGQPRSTIPFVRQLEKHFDGGQTTLLRFWTYPDPENSASTFEHLYYTSQFTHGLGTGPVVPTASSSSYPGVVGGETSAILPPSTDTSHQDISGALSFGLYPPTQTSANLSHSSSGAAAPPTRGTRPTTGRTHGEQQQPASSPPNRRSTTTGGGGISQAWRNEFLVETAKSPSLPLRSPQHHQNISSPQQQQQLVSDKARFHKEQENQKTVMALEQELVRAQQAAEDYRRKLVKAESESTRMEGVIAEVQLEKSDMNTLIEKLLKRNSSLEKSASQTKDAEESLEVVTQHAEGEIHRLRREVQEMKQYVRNVDAKETRRVRSNTLARLGSPGPSNRRGGQSPGAGSNGMNNSTLSVSEQLATSQQQIKYLQKELQQAEDEKDSLQYLIHGAQTGGYTSTPAQVFGRRLNQELLSKIKELLGGDYNGSITAASKSSPVRRRGMSRLEVQEELREKVQALETMQKAVDKVVSGGVAGGRKASGGASEYATAPAATPPIKDIPIDMLGKRIDDEIEKLQQLKSCIPTVQRLAAVSYNSAEASTTPVPGPGRYRHQP